MEPESELKTQDIKIANVDNNCMNGHSQQDTLVSLSSLDHPQPPPLPQGTPTSSGPWQSIADKRPKGKEIESRENTEPKQEEQKETNSTPSNHDNKVLAKDETAKEGKPHESTNKAAMGVETPISASTISTAFSADEFRELAEQMEAAAEMERKRSTENVHITGTNNHEEKKKRKKRKASSSTPSDESGFLAKRKPGRPRKNAMSEQQRQFDQSVVSPSANWPAIVMGDPMKELQRACQYGQTGSVEVMLKKGVVKVCDVDANQNTALHEAAVYGKVEVVKLLIKYGSPLDPVNVLNETPLMLSRSPVVSQLLKEFIARMSAARPKLHSAVLSNDLELVRSVLKNHHSEVNEVDELGFTALHWCAVKNRPDMIKCIVDSVAPKIVDLNCQSTDLKLTPLHEAARFNSTDAAQCLLELHADPLIGDTQGFLALDHSPNKLMRRLFRRFGRKNNIPELLRSPKLLAVEEGDEPESLTLDEHHDNPSSNVGFTREERKLQQVLSILGRSEGSPPKSSLSVKGKKRGRPPKSSISNVSGRPSSQTDKSTGRTLLHRCADKGNVQMLKELIEMEPDLVNATDHAGFTPLHEAALKGQVEAARLLLEANARPNVQAISNGDTPLHDAAENGHLEIVKLLLEAKADKALMNSNRLRAIDVTDDPEIMRLLKASPEDELILKNRLERKERKASSASSSLSPPQPTPQPQPSSSSSSSSPPVMVKRKPGRPRKQSTIEVDHNHRTSVVDGVFPLILVNLDAKVWHFLSCQLEDRSALFRLKFREDYGRELNADDRDRLLLIPKITNIPSLQEALKNDHRSIYLVDKAAVMKTFPKLLKEAQFEHIDIGKKTKETQPSSSPPPPPPSNNLPLKFKMKQQWKLK